MAISSFDSNSEIEQMLAALRKGGAVIITGLATPETVDTVLMS